MSAVPDNFSALGQEPVDSEIVNVVLASAQGDTVVLSGSSPNFDSSINALFEPVWLDFFELGCAAETDVSSMHSENYPMLVLHTTALGFETCKRVLECLPGRMPVVLLHDAGNEPAVEMLTDSVVASICNDRSAGAQWQRFIDQRDENRQKLVVLDFIEKDNAATLQDYLVVRNYRVIFTGERLGATFAHADAGCQLLMVEIGEHHSDETEYLLRLRFSHESDALGIIVSGDVTDSASRCALLEAGADDLLPTQTSNAEIALRLNALSKQQSRAQQIRRDAYRFPGSTAYNADFLINVGNKLYASAQRDVMTMALARLRVVFTQPESVVQLSPLERSDVLQMIANHCTKNLRETDLLAQCGERDFITLVTCVSRKNIALIFSRLSQEIIELVEHATEGRASVHLQIGATPELGVSFKSMMIRAQHALDKAEKDPENWLVIN